LEAIGDPDPEAGEGGREIIPEFPPELVMIMAGTIGVAADIIWYVH
jgi:hypothetical protein